MAETVHLFLKLNGEDILGDSTQTSLGRENSIECLQFLHQVKTGRDAASGQTVGKRQHDPITIVKRIDRSSPLLIKGLTKNEVAEGVLKFYRPKPSNGTTEQFYTVEFKQGRVSSVKQYVEDVLNPATAERPPLEEVSFVFTRIVWTYEDGNITHEDAIPGR